MARREASFYKASEGQAAEARLREQEASLRMLLAKAVDTSPAVRAVLTSAKVSPSSFRLQDLERLPLLRKNELPSLQSGTVPFGGWLGGKVGDLRRIFVSPGPIYDPEGHEPDYWGFAPALHAAGFRRGALVLNTFSYHLTPAGAMFDGALAVLGCVTIPSGTGNLEIQIKTLLDLKVSGYIGTPSFLAALVAAAGASSPLRVAFVSGEPLGESQRREVESRAPVRISQGYSIGDLGLIGYECSERTGFHLDDRVIVEVVDQNGAGVADGEVGEVAITFLSHVYPLLRLATGDLSQWAAGECRCGRTTPRLSGIMGRVGEGVKVKGLFLYPHDLDQALARHSEVRRYQAVITRPEREDILTIRVESDVEDRDALGAAVAKSVEAATRLNAGVEVIRPGMVWVEDKKIVDRRTWE